MALNPSSSDNALAQANPNYDPVIECPDNQRTVRIVASKRISVTLGSDYQGRRISITNSEWILLNVTNFVTRQFENVLKVACQTIFT